MIYVQCLNWASFSEHLSVSNRVHSYILCPTVKLVLLSTMYVCVLSAIFGVDFPIELNSKFSLYYYSVFSSFVYSSDLSLNTTTNTNLLWKLSKKKQFFNLHVVFLGFYVRLGENVQLIFDQSLLSRREKLHEEDNSRETLLPTSKASATMYASVRGQQSQSSRGRQQMGLQRGVQSKIQQSRSIATDRSNSIASDVLGVQRII